MVLVDTAVWVDHLRSGEAQLAALLHSAQVLMHPHVLGELALGNLQQRQTVLQLLQGLPLATLATEAEVLALIDTAHLPGTGIGYTDAHLLAAVRLAPGSRLWTKDKRLHAAAQRLGLAWRALH